MRIKSEEYYLGDASRFLRFLLARLKEGDIKAFGTHFTELPKAAAPVFTEILCFCPERAENHQYSPGASVNIWRGKIDKTRARGL